METETPCQNGHVWLHHERSYDPPERGALCDCGQKKWDIPLVVTRAHQRQLEWTAIAMMYARKAEEDARRRAELPSWPPPVEYGE